MIHLPSKPIGSMIDVQSDFNGTTLSWKNPRGGLGRYGTLLFLMAWMCGWAFGEVSALNSIRNGEGELFLIFWAIGWTVGGAFCAVQIFRLARPSRPERITLDSLYLFYEPGTGPLETGSDSERTGVFKALKTLKPRRRYRVAKKDLGEIRIDRVGERQRLSFDYGAERIEVGAYLKEPEREWLFAVLKSWKSF